MSNLIQIQKGVKRFSTKTIFDEASFAVNEGEHIGVVGPNGAGKTTLFKILAGQEDLDGGLYIRSRQLRLGYLAQEDDWQVSQPLMDLLESKATLPLWQVQQLAYGLGFTDTQLMGTLKDLSGGFRMRFQLLQELSKEPNLLLLDEPTNYLDLESLLVLENFLQEYQGAFLLISHDREFLRKVTHYTLEVEGGELTKFGGTIDDYFEQKALLQSQLEKQHLSQESRKKQILDFVTRFGAKASKAKQAQSKLKQLTKMESLDLKPLPSRVKIRIPKPMSTGKEVLRVKDLRLGYGEKIVLEGIDLSLIRGDHLGIVGRNGAGKSTLLKGVAGVLKPLKGEIHYGYQVDVAYFAQHSVEVLDKNQTVLEAIQSMAHPDTTPQEILGMAGSLLFSKDDGSKKISYLSGGEKTRVCLAGLLLQRKPFLILDEPTNHLDFDTVENLTTALSEYEGTILTVSHDRGFIARVSNKLLEIHNGKGTLYPGTYDEYLWSVQKRVHGQENFESSGSSSLPPQGTSSGASSLMSSNSSLVEETSEAENQIKISPGVLSRKNSKRMSQIEKELGELEKKKTALASKLEKEASQLGRDEIQDLSLKYSDLEKKIHQLEEEWLVIQNPS